MSTRRQNLSSLLIVPGGLFALVFLVFGWVLLNDFVRWDDGYLIIDNPAIRAINRQTLRHIFTTYDPELYIPLTLLSYQIDYVIWGLSPFGFHLTNLLLHAANAVLVFFFVRLLLRIHSSAPTIPTVLTLPTIPIIIALLFAVHPLHTETVAWASARKDLLSAFFFLLSLCGYLTWRAQERVDPSIQPVSVSSRVPRQAGVYRGTAQGNCPLRMTRSWYLFSLLSFLLGLLAKVTIIPLPFVLLLIDWFLPSRPLPAGEGRVRGFRHLVPYFLLSIIFGVVALFGKLRNIGGTSLQESILLGAKSFLFFFQKLFWPTHLSVLYPYTDIVSFWNPDLLLPLVLLLALPPFLWLLRRRFPLFIFCVSFSLLLFLPTITTFRKGDDVELDLYFFSDRYAYLPSIGILLLLSFLVFYFLFFIGDTRNRSPATCFSLITRPLPTIVGMVVPFVMFLFLSHLSHKQALTWHDTETLFRTVLRSYPNAHIAHNNLGLFEQEKRHTDTAISHYEQAIAIKPTGRSYYNLALAYMAIGKEDESLRANEKATALNPNHVHAWINLGALLAKRGEKQQAIAAFEKAASLQPPTALVWSNLGILYTEQGRREDAIHAYSRALAIETDDIESLIGLSSLYADDGRIDDALILTQRAVQLSPKHPGLPSLLRRLSLLQATP